MKEKITIQSTPDKWTSFQDMSSGGKSKLEWDYIYINYPEDKAAAYFEERFGRSPYNITCYCCGKDYSIRKHNTLKEAVYGIMKLDKQSFEEFIARKDVLVLEM